MRNKIIFGLVVLGIAVGTVSAYVYAAPPKPLPPAFNPAANPYAKGIYANGIIESDQSSGENTNINPEVSGTVTEVLVHEGEPVARGTLLLKLEDSVQRATWEQQKAQAEAATAMLQELRAQPRPETLNVAEAQVQLAKASLKTAEDEYQKQKRSYDLEPRSVSKDALDNAANAAEVARTNLAVVDRQYELTKAGAWVYDIRNQERQVDALTRAAASSEALLAKYSVRAPRDGVVLSILATPGAYVSPQGAYDTYTQGYAPALVMGSPTGQLNVRAYIDEILIPRLSAGKEIKGKMFVRGTDVSVPLEFVRVQPYVSPKIELSDARLEKVDLRVLPVIFRFQPPQGMALYPGQLVDVYVDTN